MVHVKNNEFKISIFLNLDKREEFRHKFRSKNATYLVEIKPKPSNMKLLSDRFDER